MVAVSRHTWLRGYARAIGLIPLHVALIRESLLGVHRHVGHVVVGHVRVLGNARSVALRREVLVGRLFRGLDLVTTIDAVLVARSRLGSIQTGLIIVSRWFAYEA